MKINLGCGSDIRPGYVNVDLRAGPGVDLVADFRAIPLGAGCVQEIVAQDILEHVSWRETRGLLRAWRRLLAPGGRLWIRTPDLAGIVQLYRQRPPGWGRDDGEEHDVDPIVDRLYGGQDYPGNFHYAIFDQASLCGLLVDAGFVVADVGPDGEDISNLVVVGYRSPEVATRGMTKVETGGKLSVEKQAEREAPRVTWSGPLLGPSGYAEAGRSYVRGLDALNARVGTRPLWDCPLEFTDIDSEPSSRSKEQREGWTSGIAQVDGVRRRLRVRSPADAETLRRILALSLRPGGGVCVFQHPPGDGDGRDFIKEARARHRDHRRFVSYTTFETDRIPDDWVSALDAVDEIWVPTHFNLETFSRSGIARERIHVIPHAFDGGRYRPHDTAPLKLGDEAGFTFLSIFEWTHRKGWDVLLRAYLSAFTREDDVRLLVRTYQGGGVVTKDAPPIREQLVGWVRELGYDPKTIPRIDLIEKMIPAEEMPALYRAGDAFVLPTRGEGWGLPLTEALLMETPVIATRWSGQLEFLHERNAYLIDIEGVKAVGDAQVRDNPMYAGHRWAEPSSEHLVTLMRHVVGHRQEARDKARRGREEILAQYSEEAVAHRIMARLEALGDRGRLPAMARRRSVLIQARPNVFKVPGGDTEVIVHMQRALESRGFDVDFSSDAALNLDGVDIVHIINAEEPFALNAARQQVPYVVTPLYEDMQRYLPRAMATITAAQRLQTQGRPPGDLSAALDEIFEPLDAVVRANRDPHRTFVMDHAWAISASGQEEAARIQAELAPGVAPTVVPVGFDPPMGAPISGDLFVERYGVRDFVLCVGRLESRKNQLALIAALADEDVPLVFVNSTTGQPEYEMLCKRWRRRAPTLFTGRLSRAMLNSAYAAAKVHALPSWFELPGLVTLEAAWHGLNVVASRWGTLSDYLGDRVFYCEPDDIESIRAATRAALDAPPPVGCREELERFTWPKVAPALESLYEDVLRRSSSFEGRQRLVSSSRAGTVRLENRLYHGLAEQAIAIDPNRAFSLATELLASDPLEPGMLAVAARAALSVGDLDRARKHFEQEIAVTPLAGADAFLYLALCLREAGARDEAASLLRGVEPCFPFATADTRRLFAEYGSV